MRARAIRLDDNDEDDDENNGGAAPICPALVDQLLPLWI